jgi:DNA-binding response OmpR family regulator
MHPTVGTAVIRRMDVLIVERDELIASVLADALSEDGIDTATVSDEDEALIACRAQTPRVIITGINRRDEDMKGLGLGRSLQKRWPWLSVVYLAALWPFRLQRGALGIRERFLTKPVAMRSLVGTVRELLAP